MAKQSAGFLNRIFLIAVAVFLGSIQSIALAKEATIEFDIEATELGSALNKFALQSNKEIIFLEGDTAGKTSNEVVGAYAPTVALEMLLAGTALTFQVNDLGTVVIGTIAAIQGDMSRKAGPDSTPLLNGDKGDDEQSLSPEAAHNPNDSISDSAVNTHPVLEVVLVTATKRESNLQDVPISVSVMSGQTLKQLSIDTLEEMSSYIPNLHIADTSITTNVYIRGIGSGLDRGFEQSVGLFIDGIYMGRSKQYRAPMFDVDRVEVLRGPQPVLFGKNTTAGAIKIETRKPKPGEALSADFMAEYETQFHGFQYQGVVSGSPSESTGLRFALLYADTDGFARNTYLDVDEPGIEQWIARLTGVWNPSDSLFVTAKYEHADFKNTGQLGEPTKISFMPAGNPLLDYVNTRVLEDSALLDPTLEDKTNFKTHSDNVLTPQGADQSVDNAAVIIDMPLNSLNLTTELGYSAYDYQLNNDVDFLPVPFTAQDVHEDFDQQSVEVRLASSSGGQFDFLTGLYWQQNDLSMLGQTLVNWEFFGPLVNLPSGPTVISSEISGVDYGLDTNSWSGFVEVTWRFSPDFQLELGGRYSDETKKNERTGICTRLDGQPFDPNNPSDQLAKNIGFCPRIQSYTGKINEDFFMPSVQLQWSTTDDVMAYAKWAKSYKSGGFNAGIFATNEDIIYEPEKATGSEIGLKSTLADGAAVLNLALFHEKFDDLQVNTLTGAGQTLLSNAGAATSKGVELEGKLAVTNTFTVGGSLAYLDAKYDDYARGPCNAVQRSEAAVAQAFPCVQDLTGKTTTYAPKWSSDIFGDIEFPISSGLTLRLRADVGYTDDYFYSTDLDPNLHQTSAWKFDARITLADAAGVWDVSLLGKNLSNNEIVVWGTGVPLVLGTYVGFTELPRTIALQANYHFGAK